MWDVVWQVTPNVGHTIGREPSVGSDRAEAERVGHPEPVIALGASAREPSAPPRSAWRWRGCPVDQRDIDAYLPLVRRVVQKVARRLPANVQRDDLLAAGVCGLVDSLRRNGGDGGAAFAWYARVRIRGAIFDELRAQDWLSRRVRARLDGADGEAPACFVSFEDVAGGDETELAGGDDPSELVEASAQRKALAAAMAQLPERERLIVARYYFDGARLKDIGAELGLSEPRISQILARALGRLREMLVVEAA
jgi:RNA polymerase sigma factor for flagellar operon FliA